MRTQLRGRGYIPHLDSPGATQFITFRLADSLPADFFRRWFFETEVNPQGNKSEIVRAVEAELDRAHGACHLRIPQIASLVENALRHFDGDRYGLLAWVIMPNHVHVIVELKAVADLGRIVHGWKWRTAKLAHALLGQKGRFWQPEYFDRRIRDSGHLRQCIEYVELNPVKAGLCHEPEDWPWSSARARGAGGKPTLWL